MSIEEKIEAHVAAGVLLRYEPVYAPPGLKHEREVLMTEEAYQQCPPKGKTKMGNLKGSALANARAILNDYVFGERVFEGRDFKLLNPENENVWEIRVLERPQHRLFGYFVSPDFFLITHCVSRNKLEADDGPKWDHEIEKCVRKRERLVSDLPPYVGRKFQDYFTRNGVPEHG